MKGLKGRLVLLAGTAVFTGVLYRLGFSASWEAVKGARLPYIGLTLLLFGLASCIRICKWALMKDRMGADIGLMDMAGVYFSSKFWGLVSPMRSGEVVPALASGGRRGGLLSIILYDRVLETFQSLMVFAALFFLLYGVFFDVKTGYALACVSSVLALFTFVLVSRKAGESVFAFADGALSLLGGRRVARALLSMLRGFKGDMDEFYGATRSFFTVGFSLGNLALTFVCWGVDMLSWFSLFKAFSINMGMLATVAAVMVYSMIAALAPIPWGLGVSDLSFALVLGRFGYSGEAGGLIVASRVLVMGFALACYGTFSLRLARKGL